MKIKLYLEAFVVESEYGLHLKLHPVSKAVLFLCRYPIFLDYVYVTYVIRDNTHNLSEKISFVNLKELDTFNFEIVNIEDLSDTIKCVDLPVCMNSSRLIIFSGAAAAFRFVLQTSHTDGAKVPLFGQSQSCLKSCKERSKWTLLCETAMVDYLNAVESGYGNLDFLRDLNESFLVKRQCPNRYKGATKEELYKYLEGPSRTLVDIIVAFYLTEYSKENELFGDDLRGFEKVSAWLKYVEEDKLFCSAAKALDLLKVKWDVVEDCRLEKNEEYSYSIVTGLEKLSLSEKGTDELRDLLKEDRIQEFMGDLEVLEPLKFDWDLVPEVLRPSSSSIPLRRQQNKADQLLNLVHCATDLIGPDSELTIVDFCSGGGHLGLFFAALYPKCHVVLLENKEESLRLGEDRVRESGLSNVHMYRCNIFAYRGRLDLGLALHACGSVTDLVLSICRSRGAHAVVSPCCYGSITPGPTLAYPRSSRWQDARVADMYSRLAHAAECARGPPARLQLAKEAMRLIDTDRCMQLTDTGRYCTRLCCMSPIDCTPKNHVIVATALHTS